MFDGIAPEYDRLNHLMSFGVDRSWRRRALREIIIPAHPQQLLDIACGTATSPSHRPAACIPAATSPDWTSPKACSP